MVDNYCFGITSVTKKNKTQPVATLAPAAVGKKSSLKDAKNLV